MQLQLEGLDAGDKVELGKAWEDAPNDSFDRDCHSKSTPAQVSCLQAAKTMREVRACVVDVREWSWLRPLLVPAFLGFRIDLPAEWER